MINKEEMKKRVKKSNKGFSLVELIVVIAIMAILVGVVGMQVIPYIEKSKESKDEQIVSAICTSAVTAFANNAGDLKANYSYTLTISTTGTACSTATASGSATGGSTSDAANVVTDFISLTKYNDIDVIKAAFSSKDGSGLTTITIDYNTDGTIKVTPVGCTKIKAVSSN